MKPNQVVRLVGEHMLGKVTLSPLQLTKPNIPLADISTLLKKRQAAMRLKPNDTNAATHLIRSALGGTAYGVDHGKLSQMLSLHQDMVRMLRDDITIQVIFFDDEYLRTVKWINLSQVVLWDVLPDAPSTESSSVLHSSLRETIA